MKTAAAIALSVLVLATACTRSMECGDKGDNANVSGIWTLTAEGDRSGCVSHAEEAQVEIRSEVALAIQQDPGGSGALDQLSLAQSPAGSTSFTLVGTVEGGCVEFTTSESGPGYDVSLSFTGKADNLTIEGDFEEVTPAACRARGSFHVDLRPLPADAGIRRDASLPPDAAEQVDAGDAGPMDAMAPDARPIPECYRVEDCKVGVCLGGVCTPVCSVSTDCHVGEACADGRCEKAPGCGCSAGGAGAALGLLGLLGLALPRRKHRQKRGAAPG